MSENTPQETVTTDNQDTPRRFSRRNFLRVLGIGTGALAVGVVAGWPIIKREARLAINGAFLEGGLPDATLPDTPFTWIEITPDNIARLHTPKSEMGQGIYTSLTQLVAEDLELDWDLVETRTADTSKATGFDGMVYFTFGSVSTSSMYKPMREIAANMRVMLEQEGANQLGVSVADVEARESRIVLKSNPETNLTYGEIVVAKQGEWVLPEEAPVLKPNADFKFIGQSMPRVDFRDKVTGRAVFGFDARVDGMAYGAVARPPRYGATLASASAGDAASQPGVLEVVIRDGFAGIVAESRIQAQAALAHLDLTWDGGSTWSQDDLEDFMQITDGEGTLVQRVGNYDAAVEDARVIEAEYSIPLASHAHLEPQSALVDVREDGVTVYCSTQGPILTRDGVAEAIGVEPETVNVITTYLGGGFGRKIGKNASVEAAILSQASGRPVHVGWTRTEEMQHGYHRPPARNRLRGLLDADGNITAIQHQISSGDIFFGIGTFPAFLESVFGADPLAIAFVDYMIPNRQVVYHRKKLPIATGSWRGLGTMPNTFASESFIDELAHEAGIDPYQIRLNHLPDDEFGERMRGVLDAVVEASDWANVAGEGSGYGMALGRLGETVVAMVAKVSATDSGMKIEHVWCAADPGMVVNPNGARAQVEGTIMMALSSVLHEKLTIEDGAIVATNFPQYPLITIHNTPEIEVLFVESSDSPVGGFGEAVIGIVPAAIGNAYFSATGVRQRHLPFSFD